MDTGLTERLREATPAVFAGTPVVFAYLFGSRARGQANPRSDVDVAVYGAGSYPSTRSWELLGFGAELERAAAAGSIDIVALDAAPLSLVGRVLRDRVLLYSRDEPLRVRFESTQLRLFLDFQFHAEPLARQTLMEIATGKR